MKTRNLKSQIKTKQKKIHSGEGFPGKSEGQDGDLTVRYVSGRGLFLCHKRGGKWYTNRFSEYMPTTSEKNEPIVIPRGRKPRLPGEISIARNGKTHVRAGAGQPKQVVGMNTNSKILDITEFKITRANTATSHSIPTFSLENTTGHANLHIKTLGSTYDPYILFSYFSTNMFSS